MHEAPLQNLLVSIPGQASNIAISCVGQIIEGQIQNPQKMARNLKRIGSKVSDWGMAMSGQMHEAGDGSFFRTNWENNNPEQNCPLLDLPMKVKCKIWSSLNTADLLNVRLVCKQIGFEVETEVGLPFILNTQSETCMRLLHIITTRTCFVICLHNFMYLNFLPRPDRMEEIRFHKEVIVPPELMDLVMRKFSSLRKLSFHTQEMFEVILGTSIEQITPSVTSENFKVLDQKRNLTRIVVKFEEETSTLKWDLGLKPRNFNDVPKKQSTLCQVNLVIPSHQVQQQKDCITMLERQKEIVELNSDLENMDWKKYSKPISNNAKHLTSIYLLNMATDKGSFDCKILEDCKQLRILSISGNLNAVVDDSLLNVTGVQWLPRKNLRIMDLENVLLKVEEFDLIEKDLQKTVWIKIRMSLCGKKWIIRHQMGDSKFTIKTVFDSRENESNVLFQNDSSDEDLMKFEFDEDFEFVNEYHGQEQGLKQKSGHILCKIPPNIMRGILLTAYLAFC